ncbi:MAG TPA: alcohol dehydrogenase catalytic domain-containing protein [Pirellulaceae bacterium]|nr:alcohol dehydrogenase catalytic domain-containing protein [Pirellulaceae bacterium]
MTTRMDMSQLELVAPDHPDAQNVAVLSAPYEISIARAEIPEPRDGEVRVKIKWVGICGSDVEVYRGARNPEFLSTPIRLGHEVAGSIDKLGPHVEGLRVGDRVTCRYVWGAFAEYLVCKPFNVKVVPTHLPLEDASLIEVLPGVIHSAELAQIDQTKNVLIMGQGVSGLVLTQVFRLYSPGALVVTDLKDCNLQLARKYGATHVYKMPSAQAPTMDTVRSDFPNGFDVVVPCLLEGDGVPDAIDCAALCGRIVLYGCLGVCHKPIDFYALHRKRLEIYTTEPRRDIDMIRYFQQSVQLVTDGLVNTTEMITHRVPLSNIAEAFALRTDQTNDAIHVLVDCES